MASLDFEYAHIVFLTTSRLDNTENLVTMVDVRVDSATENIYENLIRGYLRLEGRIRQIFSLSISENANREPGRKLIYEIHFDIEEERTIDEALYCLPIGILYVRPDNERSSVARCFSTHCLLLKKINPNAAEYTRVGTLGLPLDSESNLDPSLH